MVPAKGADSTLDLASWNLQWLGDRDNGPEDDLLQRQNVHAVIAGADMDIWGLAEIVSVTQWNALRSGLPGYAGLLAGEDTEGRIYYEEAAQKLGILYKTSLATLEDARLILTEHAHDFAGRPPLQVTLRVTLDSLTQSITVIVLHAKCCRETSSWQQRVDASSVLKAHLDDMFPNQKVWVIGDFNDDIDTSITPGLPSPYVNFAADSDNYAFATRSLSDARFASTVDYAETIDHHLGTNEANDTLVSGSAEVYRVDDFVPDYGETTSDHYPVLSRYRWNTIDNENSRSDDDAGGPRVGGDDRNGSSVAPNDSPGVVINEIGANEPGSDASAEFVELVNLSDLAIDIGTWTISDATGTRHTFAPGTRLAAGSAVVVFGGREAISRELTNAVAASSGGLSLANGGDTVVLCNAMGAVVDSCSYLSSLASTDGVSLNRTPDGGHNPAFVPHTDLSTLSQSPGRRVDGTHW